MKIVFDINTPAPSARFLRGHAVTLALNLGWHLLKNGKLLDACEAEGYDCLITCDRSLPYQQNFAGRKLSVVVISSNNWPLIRPVAARIATQVDFAQRGQVIRIDIDSLR
jgi:hypothetical protein